VSPGNANNRFVVSMSNTPTDRNIDRGRAALPVLLVVATLLLIALLLVVVSGATSGRGGELR
jgi:NADH:ubiquinone oxidoreductase subunit 6 (subunit J)